MQYVLIFVIAGLCIQEAEVCPAQEGEVYDTYEECAENAYSIHRLGIAADCVEYIAPPPEKPWWERWKV